MKKKLWWTFEENMLTEKCVEKANINYKNNDEYSKLH